MRLKVRSFVSQSVSFVMRHTIVLDRAVQFTFTLIRPLEVLVGEFVYT